MKYFNNKLGDNESKAWKLIVKLFQGKDVEGNENFLGIERAITRAKNDYDAARRRFKNYYKYFIYLWNYLNILIQN